jgi:hypothetical protein
MRVLRQESRRARSERRVPHIGKAAMNERIKLRATYYNNVPVGATITGSIVPFLAYAREFFQNDNRFTPAEFAVTLFLILVAAMIAAACRFHANSMLSKMED